MRWGHPDQDKLTVFLGDFVLIAFFAILGWYLPGPDASLSQNKALSLFLVVPAFLASLYVFDLYSLNKLNGLATLAKAAIAVGSASIFCYLVLHLVQWHNPVYTSLKFCTLVLPVAAYVWRRGYFLSSRHLRVPENMLVIGGPCDATILNAAIDRINSRYNLIGILQQEAEQSKRLDKLADAVPLMKVAAAAVGTGVISRCSVDTGASMAPEITVHEDPLGPIPYQAFTVPILGDATPEALLQVVAVRQVQVVVVRTDAITHELAAVLTRLRFTGIQVCSLLEFCMRTSEELPVELLNGFWLCVADGFELLHARFFRRVKRLGDVFLATLGLLFSFPFMLLAAIAVRIDSPGPVFFRQIRVGWHGRTFELLKFRSMRMEAEKDGRPQWASVDDPRITRVGNFLRKTHLDELPQMINILRGEMSFVGPRPERPEFVGLLSESISFYELRHCVLPGVTGWAQVNYPYGASIEDAKRKLQYDLYYVCNASPLLDFRTMLRTARVILFRQGSR